MTDDLAVHQFPATGQQIRVIDRDGEPWFVAADVCAALNIANVGDVLMRLDDDERDSIAFADGTPGNPTKGIVNEAGLYSLILRSRKPEAKAFKRWVTHDVLPAIRKTGGYQMEPAPDFSLDPDLARIYELTLGMQQTRERQRVLEAEQQRMAGELQGVAQDVADLKALSPMASNTLLSLRDTARAVTDTDMGQNRFKRWLVQSGIMFTDHQGHDRFHQQLVNTKLGIERWEQWQNGNGYAWVPYFTPVGVARLRRLYMDQQDATKAVAA